MEAGIYSSMRERLSHLPGTLAQGERVNKVKTAHVVHGIKTPPPQSIFHHVNRITTDLSQEQDLSLQVHARDMKQQSALKESWTSCKTLLFFRF